MIELGAHAEFIVGAYSFVGLVSLGLVALAIVRGRAARQRLKKLESEGLGRRSGAGKA